MEAWELTAREAIRDTIHQYANNGDRLMLEQLADCFCEDGILEVRGSDPAVGHAAIMKRVGGIDGGSDETRAAAKAAQEDGRRRIIRHAITNIAFERLEPSKAVVVSYFTAFSESGLDHFGRYRDAFVRIGDRWLIEHRLGSVDWQAEDAAFSMPGGPVTGSHTYRAGRDTSSPQHR